MSTIGFRDAAWGRIDPGLYDHPADQREAMADALLEDPQFIWDFMGDVDQGEGLQEQAVKAIVRAVMSEMKRNPALAHRYRRLAEKEAESALRLESEICR